VHRVNSRTHMDIVGSDQRLAVVTRVGREFLVTSDAGMFVIMIPIVPDIKKVDHNGLLGHNLAGPRTVLYFVIRYFTLRI